MEDLRRPVMPTMPRVDSALEETAGTYMLVTNAGDNIRSTSAAKLEKVWINVPATSPKGNELDSHLPRLQMIPVQSTYIQLLNSKV